MIWFMRKAVSWSLTLGGVALLLVLVLPGDYRREVSVLIRAPRSKVYAKVRQLNEWNALAMFSDLTRKKIDIPPEVAEYADRESGSLGWLGGNERRSSSEASYLPQLRITEARYPALLVYRVDGGPLPGVEPRVIIEEAPSRDWKALTKVTIREEYRFMGFWAGIKALSARFAAEKLHRRDLEKLRELCEEQEQVASADAGFGGIPLISGDAAADDTRREPANDSASARPGTAPAIQKAEQDLRREIAQVREDLRQAREELSRLNARTGEAADRGQRILRPAE